MCVYRWFYCILHVKQVTNHVKVYKAMAVVVCLWLIFPYWNILKNNLHKQPGILWQPNNTTHCYKSSFSWVNNHIGINCHLVWEKIQASLIFTFHVNSQQLTDFSTESLGYHQFHAPHILHFEWRVEVQDQMQCII